MINNLLNGIWAKPSTMGEYKIMIDTFHIHSEGKVAKVLYSFEPFNSLRVSPISYGKLEVINDSNAMIKFEDNEEFKLTYISGDQLVIEYLKDKRMYKKLSKDQSSLNHFNLSDDGNHLTEINNYFKRN